MSREQLHQAFNGLMLVLFTSWAFFQYNDADAPLWITVYGLVVVLVIFAHYDRLPRIAPAIYGGVVALWGIYLATRVVGQQSIIAEEGREMIGSFLAAAFMAYLVIRIGRRRTADRSPETAGGTSGPR